MPNNFNLWMLRQNYFCYFNRRKTIFIFAFLAYKKSTEMSVPSKGYYKDYRPVQFCDRCQWHDDGGGGSVSLELNRKWMETWSRLTKGIRVAQSGVVDSIASERPCGMQPRLASPYTSPFLRVLCCPLQCGYYCTCHEIRKLATVSWGGVCDSIRSEDDKEAASGHWILLMRRGCLRTHHGWVGTSLLGQETTMLAEEALW